MNTYSNYDNGSEQYFPLNVTGCTYSSIKCPPRYKCHPTYSACIETEPIVYDLEFPTYIINRVIFQPPLPLKKKYYCPDKYTLYEEKRCTFLYK